MSPPPDPRARHLAFLERGVFQVEAKWPHYRVLLDELDQLAASCGPDTHILCLERAFVFGGLSLFAPLFRKGRFHAHDVRLEGLATERMDYQAHWTRDPECLARPADSVGSVTEVPVEEASQDLVLVPNVVHHVKDQAGMFRELARVLVPGGRGFIFETLLRELHQAPHDFVRYTPWGFEAEFAKVGLRLEGWRPAGGPFEAIAYCWDQALQYLPEDLRAEKARWLREEGFPELMALDRVHQENRVRAHTSFPVAYAIHFSKATS